MASLPAIRLPPSIFKTCPRKKKKKFKKAGSFYKIVRDKFKNLSIFSVYFNPSDGIKRLNFFY